MESDSNKEDIVYKIIGTSHISKNSVKEIEDAIEKIKPDYVCVELDIQRLQGLLSNKKSSMSPMLILKIGLFGYLFAVIGGIIQRRLGKKVNIMPGADMLGAVKAAKKNNLKTFLIDQPVQITLKRISKCFGWKERFQLVKDLLKGFFFPKKAMKEMQKDFGMSKINLKDVPSDEIVEKMIHQLQFKYPGLHKALVEERNHYMANKVYHLIKKESKKRILIVVGAGHKDEMIKIINKKLLKLEVL